MPTREELPDFARSHQLGRLARRTEPVYSDDGFLTDQEEKHVAGEGDYDADTELVEDPAEAEVVLSTSGNTKKTWGKEEPLHRPILDLDFPAALLPSTTPGHYHLYIDREIPWREYRNLLHALAAAGLIENGYRDASIAREFTSVRMPSVKKIPEQPAPEVSAPPATGLL